MTFVMCLGNISVLLERSPQKLIFTPHGWVFCALSAHYFFVSTAGCSSAFDGIPCVCLPPVCHVPNQK